MNVKRTKWTERNFNFEYPVGLFPSVMERVRGTPARIEETIKKIHAINKIIEDKIKVPMAFIEDLNIAKERAEILKVIDDGIASRPVLG